MTATRMSRRSFVARAAVLAPALALALAGCDRTEDAPPASDGPARAANSQDEPQALPSWTQIEPQMARDMMLEPGAQVTVLDVRTQQEYDEAHIEGALLLPYDLITQETAEQVLPAKDATVLVYCRSGRRSALAAQDLAELGYTEVYDFGGINDWPYGTVATQSAPPAGAVVPPAS